MNNSLIIFAYFDDIPFLPRFHHRQSILFDVCFCMRDQSRSTYNFWKSFGLKVTGLRD